MVNGYYNVGMYKRLKVLDFADISLLSHRFIVPREKMQDGPRSWKGRPKDRSTHTKNKTKPILNNTIEQTLLLEGEELERVEEFCYWVV